MVIDQIKKMYFEDKLSCQEIGKKINLTVWQVIGLMKKYHLKRRSSAETHSFQFQKKSLSFTLKKHLSLYEQSLQQAGLMLYWAEGTKFDGGVVDLANSDGKMILLFLKMLRKVYKVEEKRIRILLYCYANQDSKSLINYWSMSLKIPESQFIKPYIRQDFRPEKINKMPHGLVHVRYNDKRLFMTIKQQIDIISKELTQQG